MTGNFERIIDLQNLLCRGTLSRRGFLRALARMGVSLGAAQALAACGVAPAETETGITPTPSPSPDIPPWDLSWTYRTPTAIPPVYPTGTPRPGYAAPTATPVMWEAGL